MRALQFGKTGTLDALSFVDVATPTAVENEVLVKVYAAGLNPSDVKNVLGLFPAYTTLPRIPGRDFSGVVQAGPAHLVGKAVWGTGKDLGFFRDGSHAEYLTLPAAGVAIKPDSLSFAQAASCGVPYTTAWNALERAEVGEGTRTLIIGAGAVGSAAIDLAIQRKASVVVAVRKPELAEKLRLRSIPTILLSEPETLAEAVREYFTLGAEVIFDTTGFWLAAAINALATFGRIAVIAAPPGGQTQLSILNLYRRGGSIVGINTLLYDSIGCAAMLANLGAAFDSGSLPLPQQLSERPFADAISAYSDVNAGYAEKIVFKLNE